MPRLLTPSDLDPFFADPHAVGAAADAVAEAMQALDRGAPLLAWQHLPLDQGQMRLAPGHLPGVGSSLRTYGIGGAARGPDAPSLMVLWDGTGRLLAVLADERVSLWRTAAPAWLALRLLHPDPVRTIGVLGSGKQAEGQLWGWIALTRTTLQAVRIYSPTPLHREALARRLTEATGVAVTAVEKAEEAVSGADLIGVASGARGPVLEASWVKSGALVVSIGDGQLPPDLIPASAVYVSARAIFAAPGLQRQPYAALQEVGRWNVEAIAGDVADLIAGRAPAPPKDRPVLFEMPGLSVWDTAIAALVLRWAETEGRGQTW
ncbi:MAG: hypothetical protein K6U14_09025 [Firmicutes bacterium]|nr:hypothetical protein [Alicyclobacillaceae bacterium]MCL6497753.1 hypothetical protein [Bacillota bacterium]